MKRYRIPELAQKAMKHDMISSNMEMPDFPDARIRLLIVYLDKTPSIKRNSELYALVTSLVQMGLDTHDLIDTDDEKKSEREMRTRQVNVLAGDFFSSRFYQLLAQAGEVNMVRQLSEAICEVNRQKMNLYMRVKQLLLSTDDYMSMLVELKMYLFTTFQYFMDEVNQKSWPDMLRAFTQCEIVREELNKNRELRTFKGSWAFWHILQEGTEEDQQLLRDNQVEVRHIKSLWTKYNIHNLLLDKLRQTIADIQNMLREPISEKVHRDLMSIAEPFLRITREPLTVVKEG
ncbi:heptaprenyl diphosphate synthase component 1 [Paenibacillus guangzhouensis]|uniref:heptaprenyl diphosphate synthase component 1 n=1 Tax=Paenibacillus guangzhouensis TaxID=1473112 RepID=UPI00187B7CFB|nr:heptaprenyl diphosphate synthase component 1 [Paenibacillus guangzhouensis]